MLSAKGYTNNNYIHWLLSGKDMKYPAYFILVLTLFLGARCEESSAIVRLKAGEVRGKLMTTFKDRQFYSFRGIPYAKPPTGERRYKLPEPVDPWTTPLDSTQDGPVCPQRHFITDQYVGQEDCLIINVYTPQLGESAKLPVMVFIHGGGFVFGDSTTDFYGPKRLLDKDIVYVAMNYRLGALGFLNTEDDDLPANLGLWDQNLALKWVQENIAEFGGDPESVTLFGESAGAASVHYHLLSEASKGLFQRAILQSGSVLCPWAFQEDPVSIAKEFGKKVGCPLTTSTSFLQCLRTRSAEDIVTNSSFHDTLPLIKLIFVPSVDKNKNGPKFLQDKPETLLRNGLFLKYPVITGVTKDEGIIFVLELGKEFKKMDVNFVEKDLDHVITDSSYLPKEATPYLKDLFFPNLDKNSFNERELKKNLIIAYSDILFKLGNEDTVQYIHKSVPTYMYILEHAPTLSLAQIYGIKEELGVSHADDLSLLFDATRTPSQLKGKDREVSEKMIEFWTNFAKYGNPNGEDKEEIWERVIGKEMKYFRFGYPMESVNYEFSEKVKQLRRIIRKFKKTTSHDEL